MISQTIPGRIPAEDLEAIKRLAAERGTSVSKVLGEAMIRFANGQLELPPDDKPELKRVAAILSPAETEKFLDKVALLGIPRDEVLRRIARMLAMTQTKAQQHRRKTDQTTH